MKPENEEGVFGTEFRLRAQMAINSYVCCSDTLQTVLMTARRTAKSKTSATELFLGDFERRPQTPPAKRRLRTGSWGFGGDDCLYTEMITLSLLIV